MKPKLIIEEKEKLIAKLAHEFIEIIKTTEKKSVHVALSGGSTPKELYNKIASDYHDAVDWSNVYFWFGDERMVPPDNDESNFKMIDSVLFNKLKLPYRHVIRIQGETNPENEIVNYNYALDSKIPKRNSLPNFDIVLLGLGEDGHTASIFPDRLELFDADRFAEVTVHPVTKQKRITITGSVINNADFVYFLVTGNKKANVVDEIVNTKGDYKNYPASLVSPSEGKLKWFLDTEAGANIE